MEFRESPTEKRAKEKTIESEVVEPVTKPKTTSTVTTSRTTKTTTSAEMIVYYLTGLVELLLGLRLILALTNSNGSSGVIYNLADPLTRPFYDLFYTTGGHEPGVGIILLAMLVYGLIGWGVGRLLRPNGR